MLRAYTRENTVTMVFDREVNSSHFHQIKDVYSRAEPGSEFVLDFSNVNSVESSTIGIMLVMRETLPDSQNKISCINCKPHVLEMFEISKMENLIDFPQYENAA